MLTHKSFPSLLKILSILLLYPLALVCGGDTQQIIPPLVPPPIDTQIRVQANLSGPASMGEQFFRHNQPQGYKHRRCGMCHIDMEQGILHSFIEQETTRINPFTDQPFGRIEAICTTCHSTLHLAHPVGIIPDPQKVVLPPEAKGFRGEENNLTCMSCHDWHPINTSYKYLRWPVESQDEVRQFCLHCHAEKGIRGREPAYDSKIRQDFKLMSKSNPYFKNSEAELNQFLKGYQGAIFNLTNYVKRQRGKAQTDESQIRRRGQPTLADKAKTGRKKGKPDKFTAHYKLGQAYMRRGELNNAIVYFKKAIELKPDFPPVYFELGQVYLANEWLDEAQAMFQQAIGLAPDFAPAYVGLGNLYEARGDYSLAAKVYKTALKLDPDYGPAYYQLGLLHKRDGQLDKAQAMFLKAVNGSDTDYSAAYYELGLTYKESNLSQAKEMFTQAVVDEDHAGAYYELGLIHKQKREWPSAQDMFSQAVGAKSSDPRAYYELASIYKQQGFTDRAISTYTQATKLDKGFAPAYYQLGTIFLENQQLSDASKMFSQAIDLHPDYYEANYQLAEVYYKQKNVYKAIKLYKQVIALNRDYAEAYLGLGKCYRRLGKSKQAISNLKGAIAIRPEYAQAHYMLGTVFKANGQNAKANKQFQLALKLSQPESSESPGVASLVNDKITLYKIATSLDPEDAQGFYNLGVAYMADGQLKKAVSAYQQAIDLRPQYGEALYNIALAYKAQSQWPKAIAALQRVIKLKAGFTDARHALAETLHAQGQWEQAIEQYQQILPHKPAVAYRIGQIYFNQWLVNRQKDDLEQAKEYLGQALESNPQNVAAQKSLQQAQNLLAGKIQTLLITTNDYTRIKEISQLIENNLPPTELDRLTRLYPQEAKIMFVRPEELAAPLGEELAQLKNGTASDIIRHRKQHFIIYRIDSM